MLDRGLAVAGGELHMPDEWQQILRIGPVVDTDTGEAVIDITVELCETLAAAHTAAVGRGIRVPIDYNHGTARGSTPASRRTYGVVTEMKAASDGLYARLALNAAGVEWVAGNTGNALTSPDIRGPLFDPEKPGTKLASMHIRAVSLTEQPRQNRLAEVTLARPAGEDPQPQVLLASFADSAEARAFHEALSLGARAVLTSEGYAAPDYLGVDEWRGEESGTAVVSWWPPSDMRIYRRVTWARAADGTVSVTGPSVPVEAITVFRDSESRAASAATLSRGDAPKEVPMSGKNGGDQPRHDEKGFEALLARLPDADRVAVQEVVREAEAAKAAAEEKVAELGAQLSAATAVGQEKDKAVAELSARVAGLEAAREEAAKAERNRQRDAFLLSAVSAGQVGADADSKTRWSSIFEALGEDAARAALPPEGTFGPVKLGKPVGLDGTRGEPDANRNTRIAARRDELQVSNPGLSAGDAWDMAEKEVG